MDSVIAVLLCFLIVVALAIYWTTWKIRGDLNESLGKMASELSDIHKAIEKRAGGA